METLRYDDVYSEYSGVVVVDKIVGISKSNNGEITRIHLTTGEVIESSDSINTIEARLNTDN